MTERNGEVSSPQRADKPRKLRIRRSYNSCLLSIIIVKKYKIFYNDELNIM